MNQKKKEDTTFQIAGEDLKNLEKYIRELSIFLPLPFCTVNPSGVIVDTNRAFQDLVGYQKMELIGEKVKKIFSNGKKFEELEKKLLTEKLNLIEEGAVLTKKKKKIPVRVALAVRKDEKENLVGYFLALSDISELMAFQERLEEKVKERTRELESKARELAKSRVALMNILEEVEMARKTIEKERDKTTFVLENFPEGLLFFDENDNLFSMNPRARIFFNLQSPSIDELRGKKPKDLAQNSSLEPLIKILGEDIKQINKEELKLEGGIILEISTIIVKSKEEKVGKLVVLRDVTRSKFIEKSKTEFVSIAAHQLRTPLSAIKWTIRMLLDGDIGTITGGQRDLLGKTYKSNERMIHLINDLLNITRIEEGRFLYKVEVQDIVSICEKVVVSLKDSAQKREVDLKFDKPIKKIPGVVVDAEKIFFVFQNLINNAINYTEPKGKVRVSIEYLEEKKEILVSIEDSGIGIPEDQKSRVFSRFFRAGNAIRKETDGTGLGLYIAKNVIDAHKGRIWFESKEGEGSTFRFTLPIVSNLDKF